MVAILKTFKPCLLSNGTSDWAQTWWEALGWHGDLELLNWLCSNIQDGHSDGQLENLETQMVSQIKLKLGGRHWGDIEIQNC